MESINALVHRTYRSKGFSLVELLVVIALLALMAGFAIPNVARVMPKYRLKEAARDLYSNFQLAKITAIKEGAPCAVEFINGGYKVFIDLNKNLQKDGNDTLIKQINWSEYKDVQVDSINFDNNDASNPAVCFLPAGIVINKNGRLGNGSVELKLANKQMKVVVNATSAVRIE